MMIKIMGAFLVVLGCGGYGMMIAANHKREVQSLRQLLSLLDFMECELQYRYTPLPDLCRQVAAEASGKLRNTFVSAAIEMEDQISPNVYSCMDAALSKNPDLPVHTQNVLSLLGRSLGRFDIEGQLIGLENVRSECRLLLTALTKDHDTRLRSYQTLGVCAGAALAIILI